MDQKSPQKWTKNLPKNVGPCPGHHPRLIARNLVLKIFRGEPPLPLSLIFPVDHQFPESHGCAEAARRDAKLSKPSTSARQQDRNKNRLQQALKEKGKERTKKKK